MGVPDEASADRPRPRPGTAGLFGPDSVTWRIMGEPVIWVAGLRSLYLQALNPRVMRATWQNTGFADRGEAWARFVRTAEFVRVRTYGTAAEAARAARRIRKAARRAVYQSTTHVPRQVLYFPATATSRLRGRRPGRDRDREVPAAPASAA